MDSLVQLLIFSTIGVVLVWFGYTIFFASKKDGRGKDGGGPAGNVEAQVETGTPGEPRVCPICAAKLRLNERIKSSAFPGIAGQGRLMHIAGCIYCLGGGRRRKCPVCGAEIAVEEVLFARIFDQVGRSHVHVLGCSHCRSTLSTHI
ncbi:hypothetical protein AGMMS50267_08250 [Spirochaetia bacterium]|nr:hypothetical protein AGMMS50267_08250 [Spirochaetia bacterium]